MRLAIFSDIHYCSNADEGYFKGVQRKLVHYSLPVLNKLIDEINTGRFDVAVCLGDLIQDIDDYGKDLENLYRIIGILNNIKVPVYTIPGNHDMRSLTTDDIRQVFGYEKSSFSTDIAGYHFVFLSADGDNKVKNNSNKPLLTQRIEDNDLKWLEQDLAKNELPCLIFIHFGVAEDDMKDNFWFENNSEKALLNNRHDLKKILQIDKNILGVFCGHQHWTKHIKENGIDYYSIGSLVENVELDGVPDGVWFEVDLDEKSLNIIEQHIKLDK